MRSRSLIITSSAILLCLSPVIAAQDSSLSSPLIPLKGLELTETFDGKTMDGIYKVARERSGTNKFTESFNSDGTTEYFEGPLVE